MKIECVHDTISLNFPQGGYGARDMHGGAGPVNGMEVSEGATSLDRRVLAVVKMLGMRRPFTEDDVTHHGPCTIEFYFMDEDAKEVISLFKAEKYKKIRQMVYERIWKHLDKILEMYSRVLIRQAYKEGREDWQEKLRELAGL